MLNVFKKIMLFVFLLFISIKQFAQLSRFNITSLESPETYYSKIQSEKRVKETGIYSDTIMNGTSSVITVIRYNNFISKESAGQIWTIIDKFQYGPSHELQKSEHWKTNNDGQICRCGDWLIRRNGIGSLREPHASCNNKKFDCDEEGKKIKK